LRRRAVARREPLDDDRVERAVELGIDERDELRPVRLDCVGDAPLELDDGRGPRR
jgi:hypothetical protein